MKRRRIIKSELVSSPDPKVQAQLRQMHELELKGHTFNNPRTKTRAKGSWYVSNPVGYNTYKTVGEGTL